MKLSLLRRSPLLAGLVVAATLAAPGSPASAAGGVEYQVAAAAPGFWSVDRMRAATPLRMSAKTPDDGAPPGTPTATPFTGVPTVGALFFTLGPVRLLHFCTASAVHSPAGNLLLTAAHCVSGPLGQASNVAFVPGYHDGTTPYGVWAVNRVTVAPGWASSQDPTLDFAFLTVAGGLEQRTGANVLGIDTGYDHTIEVIGYPLTSDQPIGCQTRSFQAAPDQAGPHQQQFYCHGFTDGTSGSPWLTGYDPATGRGTVVGDIGGFQGGGTAEYTSYSPYFDSAILDLYRSAVM